MNVKRGIVVAVIAVFILLVILLAVFTHKDVRNEYSTLTVEGKGNVAVELADTVDKRLQGLSNRRPLSRNHGMLFLFDTSGFYGIWMRDMYFPLDIIWIEDDMIVHIEKNVPYPTSNTPLSDLPIYTSAKPADKILEVPAGWADKHNIVVGDRVEIAL